MRVQLTRAWIFHAGKRADVGCMVKHSILWSFRGGDQPKIMCALCFKLFCYWISQDHGPSCTFKHIGAPVKILRLSNGRFNAPGTCTLCTACFSLRNCLHSYSFRAEFLLYWICRWITQWDLWAAKVSWITELQEASVELSNSPASAGYFVVLHLKIESDRCNPPICLLAFLISVWAACYTKSISRAPTKEHMWNVSLLNIKSKRENSSQ